MLRNGYKKVRKCWNILGLFFCIDKSTKNTPSGCKTRLFCVRSGSDALIRSAGNMLTSKVAGVCRSSARDFLNSGALSPVDKEHWPPWVIVLGSEWVFYYCCFNTHGSCAASAPDTSRESLAPGHRHCTAPYPPQTQPCFSVATDTSLHLFLGCAVHTLVCSIPKGIMVACGSVCGCSWRKREISWR